MSLHLPHPHPKSAAAALALLSCLACGESGAPDAGDAFAKKPTPTVDPTYEGHDADDWAVRLADRDPEARYEATQALAHIGEGAASAAAALLPTLADASPSVRWGGLVAFARLWPAASSTAPPDVARTAVDRVLQAFAEAFRGADAGLRDAAHSAAVALGPAAVPGLAACLRDPKLEVRWGALRAFADLGEAAQAALPDVLALVSREDFAQDPLAPIALWAVSRMGPGGVAPLLDVFRRSTTLRKDAGSALARAGIPGFEALLSVALSEDWSLQEDAVSALSAAAAPGVPFLVRALSDPRADVAALAASGLGRIGPDAASAVPALVATLRRRGPPRNNAASALAAIGEPARSALLVLSSDPDEGVRSAAAYALEQLGPPPR